MVRSKGQHTIGDVPKLMQQPTLTNQTKKCRISSHQLGKLATRRGHPPRQQLFHHLKLKSQILQIMESLSFPEKYEKYEHGHNQQKRRKIHVPQYEGEDFSLRQPIRCPTTFLFFPIFWKGGHKFNNDFSKETCTEQWHAQTYKLISWHTVYAWDKWNYSTNNQCGLSW